VRVRCAHGQVIGVGRRADQPEDLLQVAFARAYPFVAKVLQLQHRHGRLARQALDQESLAGADRAAQQVSHGQGAQIVGTPQSHILAQPLLECLLPVIVLESSPGLHELHEARRVVLHHFFLQHGKIRRT
jgi:hypothetical protein